MSHLIFNPGGGAASGLKQETHTRLSYLVNSTVLNHRCSAAHFSTPMNGISVLALNVVLLSDNVYVCDPGRHQISVLLKQNFISSINGIINVSYNK